MLRELPQWIGYLRSLEARAKPRTHTGPPSLEVGGGSACNLHRQRAPLRSFADGSRASLFAADVRSTVDDVMMCTVLHCAHSLMTPASIKGSLVGHEQAGIFASRARGTQSIEAIKIGACTSRRQYCDVSSQFGRVHICPSECNSIRTRAHRFATCSACTKHVRAHNRCNRCAMNTCTLQAGNPSLRLPAGCIEDYSASFVSKGQPEIRKYPTKNLLKTLMGCFTKEPISETSRCSSLLLLSLSADVCSVDDVTTFAG